MDPKTTLMKALVNGAMIAFRPNLMNPSESQQEISSVYLELKEMMRQRYRQIDTALLDIGPGSTERQQMLSQQLQEAGVPQDKEIMLQAQKLLDCISQNDPNSLGATETAAATPSL